MAPLFFIYINFAKNTRCIMRREEVPKQIEIVSWCGRRPSGYR